MTLPRPQPIEVDSRVSMRRPLEAAAWMTLAQMLFSLMAVGARIGGRDLPWQEVCAARFAVGALTAFVAARASGQSLRLTHYREAWLRSAFGTLSAAGTFFLYAAPALAIGDAATLMATAPVFVVLFSGPLLGEPIRPADGVALALGFAGIVLVARPSFSSSGHLVVIGTATAVCAALAYVWLRRIGPSESSVAIVFHFACVGTACFSILCVPVWQTPTARQGLVLLGTGFCGGVAQILMTRAYTLDNAARVSVLGYLGVVFTRTLAFPVFAEVPSYLQVGGSLLVVCAGVILARSPNRQKGARTRELPPPGE